MKLSGNARRTSRAQARFAIAAAARRFVLSHGNSFCRPIQNARDAVVARRALDAGYQGKIQVRLRTQPDSSSILEIEDDGVGMSERILTGPLLDFGSSFWASDLVRHEFPGLSASGFRSVGRYGIGFFSIFMISDDVRVRSRRWDRGLDSVCKLHFPKGLSLRPIVSSGNAEGFSGYTSTIVSCHLKADVINSSRTKWMNSGYIGGTDLEIQFSDHLAALLPGLDVVVELQLDNTPPLVIHKPISAVIKNSGRTREWLSQVSFLKYRNGVSASHIQKVSERLRPIMSKGKLVGFAALEDHPQVPNIFRGVHTIGGFATHLNLRTEAGYFGYLEVEPASAKRDGQKLDIEPNDLKAWADEQVNMLRAKGVSPLHWCYITANFTKLELDPSEILHACFVRKDAIKFMNLDEIAKTLESEPIAIFKSAAMDHVDTYMEKKSFGDYLTLVPLMNSQLLSLQLENGSPKEPNSLIGCLDRRLRKSARKLKFVLEKNVAPSSLFGTSDALLISSIPS